MPTVGEQASATKGRQRLNAFCREITHSVGNNMQWWSALLIMVVSGLTTLLVVPWVKQLAISLGAVDHPGNRKLQPVPIPSLGGVAVFFGIGVGTVSGAVGGTWLRDLPAEELLHFGAAALIVFVLGVLDDLYDVSIFKKLLLEILAAWMVVRIGWQIGDVLLPIVGQVDLGRLAPLISLVWIVGVTNAINLLDGVDGLAGGTVAIIAVSLMLFTLQQGSLGTVIVTSAIAGACLGFLRYNWTPAKIYLGDSGSLTLGFLLASCSLHFSIKAPTTVAILVPILALGLPVIDTLLVMADRFLGRTGDSFHDRFVGMFKADRQHLHHLVLALTPKRARVVLALYGLVVAFCLMAFLVTVERNMWLGIGLLVIEVFAVILIRLAGRRAEPQASARFKRGSGG